MKNILKKEKKGNNKGYLNFEERVIIEKLLNQNPKISTRKIGKILGRGKTTISEEIKRNSTFHQGYIAQLAEIKYQKKQLNKGNISKIESNEKLRNYIIEKLQSDRSPEEISGRLKLFHNDKDLDDYILYVCHETIYNFIYSKTGIKLGLQKLLRRHKKKRTKWYQRKSNSKEIIKNKVSIHQRKNIIEKRKRVGDFESDSVIFPKQKKVLNTNICRTTRLARIELVNDKTALSCIKVQKSIIYEMNDLGVQVYSFTFDNGTENVLHTQLNELGVDTYFCDPYSSYQKGSIENLNMFIRQYLPRNIDLSKITNEDIHKIQEKLNNRPRKCLGYLSPNEYFYKLTGVRPN